MNEIVERAAKAAYESWRKSIREEKLFYCSWDDLDPDTKKIQIEAQRTAIEALRDPTDEMLDAGAKHINPEGPGLWIHKRTTAGDTWLAMIDELLRE